MGKRRMMLWVGNQDRLLKVPRILRRRIIGKFPVGTWGRVVVTGKRELETGVLKRVVSQVLPEAGNSSVGSLPTPTATSVVSGVVRVCSKQNYWRKSGRELFLPSDRKGVTTRSMRKRPAYIHREQRIKLTEWILNGIVSRYSL